MGVLTLNEIFGAPEYIVAGAILSIAVASVLLKVDLGKLTGKRTQDSHAL
jgi:hypothetical protein